MGSNIEAHLGFPPWRESLNNFVPTTDTFFFLRLGGLSRASVFLFVFLFFLPFSFSFFPSFFFKMESASSPPTLLSEEQRRRIAANKARALELRRQSEQHWHDRHHPTTQPVKESAGNLSFEGSRRQARDFSPPEGSTKKLAR